MLQIILRYAKFPKVRLNKKKCYFKIRSRLLNSAFLDNVGCEVRFPPCPQLCEETDGHPNCVCQSGYVDVNGNGTICTGSLSAFISIKSY